MRLYLAATAINICMTWVGVFFGWSSPSVPLLIRDDSPVVLSPDEASWAASLLTLGATGGAFLCAFVLNALGRKRTILLTAVPAIVSWLMIVFATTPWELYASRLLSGLSVGVVYSAAPIYVGETSPVRLRGILSTMLTLAAKFGQLLGYAIGPFLSVRNFAAVGVVLPLLSVALLLWSPETPYQLIREGKQSEALKSLNQLRSTRDVSAEFDAIQRSVKIDLGNEAGLKEILFVPGNRRALCVTVGLILAQQWSGSQAIASYAEMIFDAAESGLEGKYLTIILGVVQIFAATICVAIVDRHGRKPLLLVSILGTAACTALIAIYFHLQAYEVDTSQFGWLPAVGAILYILAYCVGLAAIPFTLIGEVFPTNVKSLGSSISLIVCDMSGFAVTKSFQVVTDAGIHYGFWAFTACSLLGALFTVLYVPETKGKTLQEIQDELHGKTLT